MGQNRPLSLITCWARIGAAGWKLAGLGLAGRLLRSLASLPAAALAAVVIMFFAWSCERQARRREAAQAEEVKKQAAEAISKFQKQAADAIRDAQQSAHAVRELESQRQKLTRDAEGLRQSLDSLRQQELARINEVATLPTSEVASRVATRLQEQVSGVRYQVPGQQEQVSGVRYQVSGQQALDPLTRPALAGESASAGHPLPPGGEGKSTAEGEGKSTPAEETQNNPAPGASGERQPAPDTQSLPPSASSASGPALVLSDQGVRKVETAFLELDSCRQQAQVMGQQVSNCAQQVKLDSTLLEQQSGAITNLEAALADKDKILAQSEAEHRAELKAARGSLRSHVLRALEYFGGGFIAGVLVR